VIFEKIKKVLLVEGPDTKERWVSR